MEYNIFQLQYALDTFYFLVCGALVMWMAAGFAMLEAGLVRSKNTVEILTKNITLFAVASIMYMVVGYSIMYGGDIFLSTITGSGAVEGGEENATYAPSADFFFQVVFVATAMSIVSGAVAERMKLFAFLAFAVVMTGFIYPMEGSWTWGGNPVFGMYTLGDLGFLDFAGSGIVPMAGAACLLLLLTLQQTTQPDLSISLGSDHELELSIDDLDVITFNTGDDAMSVVWLDYSLNLHQDEMDLWLD